MVCNACSPEQVELQYLGNEMGRVCEECYAAWLKLQEKRGREGMVQLEATGTDGVGFAVMLYSLGCSLVCRCSSSNSHILAVKGQFERHKFRQSKRVTSRLMNRPDRLQQVASWLEVWRFGGLGVGMLGCLRAWSLGVWVPTFCLPFA